MKVLEYKAQGLTQKKAAEEMAVSLRTVATYWNGTLAYDHRALLVCAVPVYLGCNPHL